MLRRTGSKHSDWQPVAATLARGGGGAVPRDR